MSKTEPTLAQLRLMFAGTARGAALEFTFAQNHDARVKWVQAAIDFACNLLEQHKHKYQNAGEDLLTLQICQMLVSSGIEAAHDEDIGGHCDIVVKGRENFLWLAEAKKHSDYAWLDKGFLQLSTRYSTGVKGQDHGDVIVYCYVKDAKAMLETWRKEFKSHNEGVQVEDSPCRNPLIFCSTHKQESSGLDFHVRHKVVALYWNPRDK